MIVINILITGLLIFWLYIIVMKILRIISVRINGYPYHLEKLIKLRIKRGLIYSKMAVIKPKAIKCRLVDIPETNTRKAFLKAFLLKSPATYYKNNTKQADAKRDRSFSDLLEIVRDRFPKTSLSAVIRIIGELNKEKLCDVVWCSQNDKFVVRNPHTLKKKEVPLNPLPFMTKYSSKYFKESVGVDGISYKKLMNTLEKELKV